MANRTEDVVQYILNEVRSGAWEPGSRILSQLSLTRILGCSRTTVERAVARLCRAGVLDSRRGSGTFVCGGDLRRDDEPPQEIAVIAGVFAHLQRFSFGEMFNELDSCGLPVRWMTAGQALAALPELRRRRSAVIAYMPDPPMLLLLEELRALHLPVLLINRAYGGFDCVTTDVETSLRNGISWLAGKAGPDAVPALVSALPDQRRPYLAERIIAGYEICMELQLSLQPEHIIKRDFDRDGDEAGNLIADTLFRRVRKPLAIITPTYETAGICLEIGSRCRKLCGRDFFLLSFDMIRSSGWITGAAVLVQQYPLFRPRIEQWIRQHLGGDRSFFSARIPARLMTT